LPRELTVTERDSPAVAAPTQPPDGDTPRTEELDRQTAEANIKTSSRYSCMIDHARTLERELAAAKSNARTILERKLELNKELAHAEQSLAALQSLINDAGKELPPEPSREKWVQFGGYVDAQDYDALRQRYAALSVKCAGLEKNDKRYRWLQDNANLSLGGLKGQPFIDLDRWALMQSKECELDQAIDAAIAQGEKA